MDGDDVMGWFLAFIRAHIARHPRGDWPDVSSEAGWEFYLGWMDLIVRHGITRAEATAASKTGLGSLYPDAHPDALLARVQLQRRQAREEDAARERLRSRQEHARKWDRRERLRAAWDRLSEPQRAQIEAEIRAENPGLARFDWFVWRLCLERLGEMIDVEPIH